MFLLAWGLVRNCDGNAQIARYGACNRRSGVQKTHLANTALAAQNWSLSRICFKFDLALPLSTLNRFDLGEKSSLPAAWVPPPPLLLMFYSWCCRVVEILEPDSQSNPSWCNGLRLLTVKPWCIDIDFAKKKACVCNWETVALNFQPSNLGS